MDPIIITCHVIRKSCQQIAFVKYHSLYGGMWRSFFTDPDMIWVFGDYFGVFGGGTRLAMPKTILRAGLIVIEAWFRGN